MKITLQKSKRVEYFIVCIIADSALFIWLKCPQMTRKYCQYWQVLAFYSYISIWYIWYISHKQQHWLNVTVWWHDTSVTKPIMVFLLAYRSSSMGTWQIILNHTFAILLLTGLIAIFVWRNEYSTYLALVKYMTLIYSDVQISHVFIRYFPWHPLCLSCAQQ